MGTFKALVLDKVNEELRPSIQELTLDRLPQGDTIVEVFYSSLNYKDALAVLGEGKIIRGNYPFVPGIDFVGKVLSTTSAKVSVGDMVIGTGWGIGENKWGGYSQVVRVSAEWLVKLPEAMQAQESMAIGTAGLTAMLSILALEAHSIYPDSGEVLVTGGSGGVGSFGVLLLSQLGYHVAASTGSDESHDYLRSLGARRIVHRQELARGPSRPLESALWAGAIDTVGGSTLAFIISSIQRHGCVAACGLAGGHELHTTVYPFILRGVNLLGIDSNTAEPGVRDEAWRRLSQLVPKDTYSEIASNISLSEVAEKSRLLLQGKVRGRIVVDVNSV